jgi:hypothetical protein
MAPGRTSVSGQESVLKPGTRRSALVAGLILAASLTACAGPGNGSPSASASTSVEPTPSSTPFDVVSAFVGDLANGVLGQAAVSGTLDVGTVHATLGGTYAFGRNGAYQYEITTTIGGTRSISRGVTVNGTTYTMDGSGPWLRQVPEASDPGGGNPWDDMAGRLALLRDVGVVTWHGRPLHSLQVPGGLDVPAAALAMDPSVASPHAVLGFYALDDGTPAGMEMTTTWTQGPPDAAVSGRMVMDLVFAHFGVAATVAAPEDVWQSYASKTLSFSVAYPGGWSADASDAKSVSFNAPDESALLLIQLDQEDPQLDQASFEADVLSSVTGQFGVRSEADFPLVVAGVSVRAYEFHVSWDGDPTFIIVAPLVLDGRGYDLVSISMPGYEEDDRAGFQTFLATLAFAS